LIIQLLCTSAIDSKYTVRTIQKEITYSF